MTFDDMPSPEGQRNPIVFVENGCPSTTSRDVAAFFGKRHADVVRTIRSLLVEEPDFSQRTFALANYVDDQGKRRPIFTLNRDGFTLVAMGFTGPNALRFKWAYIQAFNRMETDLLAASEVSHEPVSPEHREFPDWPLDEIRAKCMVLEMYRKAYGPLSAQWAAPQLGFPTPPRSLVQLGRQLSLFEFADDREALE